MANKVTQKSKFILYTSTNGDVKLDVYVQNETLWLTQKMIAQLFSVEVPAISKHLANIFESGELNEKSVISILETTANDNKIYKTRFYNLDAIIAVGYRVNSQRATQFRIWATQILREYIIKGFVLNDNRLKQGSKVFGQDYFRDLLERVRSIRASERRIYQQITDIFAECSVDYNPQSQITKVFFASIQNKFHYAITGHTAAELISDRSDHKMPYMGLTTWKNAPDGRILSLDVVIAKNYLSEKQIKRLERSISGFFDYIENLIENQQTFDMIEFAESVNNFLTFNKYNVLKGKGRVSKEKADKKALEEYEEFNKTQPIESDFDKVIKRLIKEGG
ncbi:MAG: Virulence protein [Candidatus Woesebacteria bacterium GW2011_GWA1_33_30]|uniref:Virulence protein n=1 Tax=Candidatus Woesebacteria bacterium GW2011_GWA2_33_28 TaxID=1618561 RepID=A0A0G0CAU2_9BACT|nr:MAG: Virulence protein [Candidatus Woesebacteria bacterium GW2011_GWA2_33_28]KKP49067.1 MAG: Virulence protein [Candidatus Woesebacteria bacterium GW2011_GWA1_33_30]KKP50333.1 MAG: Virulence protein [Microgenomates group bacterium GW2011_GWC1_33_32]KKP52658.1 MAG: Virulence protein [Candidatus Woesebacteria bacterium GW2011_GWB1_33_38]KKP58835.1 MAG: Virulence protein [Microgenomates group bacterium GW2011_GWD1_33_9]